FSADGRWLDVTRGSVHDGLNLVRVDVATGREVAPARPLPGRTTARGGRWPNFIGPDALADVRKLAPKEADGRPAFHDFEGSIRDAVESGDGRYLALRLSVLPAHVGLIGNISTEATRVWDTATGLPLGQVRPAPQQSLPLFSPDGRLYVTTAPEGTI